MTSKNKAAEEVVEEQDGPVEAVAVTQTGSTFAERAKARAASEKRVSGASAENKAVSSSESKGSRGRK